MKTIISAEQMALIVKRLAHQVIESQVDLRDTVIIGIQPRGVFLSDKIVSEIRQLEGGKDIQYGKLDITFYRDDIRKEIHVPNKTQIDFNIENKKVILIDDVLYTGRTIRAAMDALLAFGRPSKVELCVLIDRRFNRELPIQPDHTGLAIDTIISEKVLVRWKDNNSEADTVTIV